MSQAREIEVKHRVADLSAVEVALAAHGLGGFAGFWAEVLALKLRRRR